VTDIATTSRLASTIVNAARSFEAAKSVTAPMFRLHKSIDTYQRHVLEAQRLVGVAVRDLPEGTEWQPLRNALTGAAAVRPVPTDRASLITEQFHASKRSMDIRPLAKGLAALSSIGLATADAIRGRTMQILERDAAQWTPDDIVELTTIFNDVPHSLRPETPQRVALTIDEQGLTFGEALLAAQAPEPPDGVAERLQRFVDAMRVMHDPSRTKETIRTEARSLLERGVQERWADADTRKQLRTLLCDLPQALTGTGPVGLRYLKQGLVDALSTGDNTAALDRFARAWSTALDDAATPESLRATLDGVIARDPSTWSHDDLLALSSVLDAPDRLNPLGYQHSKRSGLGYLTSIEDPADKDFGTVVGRAIEHGVDSEAESLRRHTVAMRTALDGTTREQAENRLRERLARPFTQLIKHELLDVKTLALDVPNELRPALPDRFSSGRPVDVLLDRVIESEPLDDRDRTLLERYRDAWNREVDPTVTRESVERRVAELASREHAGWTAEEREELIRIVSWTPPRTERPQWYPYHDVAVALDAQSPDADLSPYLRTYIEGVLINRDTSHVNTLIDRLERGESTERVLGELRHRIPQSKLLLNAVMDADHEWNLTGALRLASLLDKPDASNESRARGLRSIVRTLKREVPEELSLDQSADRAEQRNDKRLQRKRPGLFEPRGYLDYPHFSELGDIRSKLELVALMRGVEVS
jgi:hypothetical protein